MCGAPSSLDLVTTIGESVLRGSTSFPKAVIESALTLRVITGMFANLPYKTIKSVTFLVLVYLVE